MAVKFDQWLIDRLRKGAFAVDYLLFCFTVLMTMVSLMFFQQLDFSILFTLGDLAVIAILLYLVFQESGRENSTFHQLHIWLPIISFTLFYVQATSYDHLVFSTTFDDALMKWESTLFGDLNRFAGIPGKYLLLDELFHFFYFSYYIILFVPGLIMTARKSVKLHEMIFSLTLMMFVHYLVFILFPGDGPVARRQDIFRHGAVFIPLMNWIYTIGGEQGGGAFPSTHVTVTVMVLLYCRTEFPRSRWVFGILAIGICVATVYCSYHYIVDVLAGLVTGTAFYFIGKKVYSSWIDQRNRSGESLSRQ
ncbi:MAG TPA: phosphatase PAP2 family protein [Candidatus Marinimicrobia bacterium]|nr:phosphatase PAP2 family protein [Candidatus Neomarinimicrobiota bacterium]